MVDILNLALPYFGLIFIGFACGKAKGLPEQGFRLLIEEVKESVKATREISFNDVSDLSILREAQREIGIKEK